MEKLRQKIYGLIFLKMKHRPKKFLYIASNELGLIKIGISIDPKQRAYSLANSSGFNVEILSTYNSESLSIHKAEKKVHAKFKSNRKKGEWFCSSILDDVIEYLAEIGLSKYEEENENHAISNIDANISGEIIDILGGTKKVSEIFGIRQASVTGWREKGIPAARAMYLRVAYPGVIENAEKEEL